MIRNSKKGYKEQDEIILKRGKIFFKKQDERRSINRNEDYKKINNQFNQITIAIGVLERKVISGKALFSTKYPEIIQQYQNLIFIFLQCIITPRMRR